jgi:hypothetical protein
MKREPSSSSVVSSPDKAMQVSMSELEDLLAKSSSMDDTGMLQKLKALQLVEQMIATQEQLISRQERDGEQPSSQYGMLYPRGIADGWLLSMWTIEQLDAKCIRLLSCRCGS